MVKIKFEYKDEYTNGLWNTQTCIMKTLQDCIDWYGLGIDCEYRIVSIEQC